MHVFVKNVNLFAYCDTYLLERYFSVRWLGCTLPGPWTALFAALIAAVCAALAYAVHCGSGASGAVRIKLLRLPQLRYPKAKKRSLFSWEFRKKYVNTGVAFIAAALLVFRVVLIITSYPVKNTGSEAKYRAVAEGYAPVGLPAAYADYEEESSRVIAEMADAYLPERLHAAGEITEEEYNELAARRDEDHGYYSILNRLERRFDYLTAARAENGDGVRFVYDTGLEKLFGAEADFFLLLIIMLFTVNSFCSDSESGADPLIRATGGGRGKRWERGLLDQRMFDLAKKQTKLATIQANQNHIAANGGIGKLGIMGGVDVFSVTGVGGIGKSSAISRSISVITRNSVIETAEPYSRIIPVLTVQCPYDCSTKGLLFSILTGVDNLLGTNYVQRSIRTRATTDMMIAQLANTCLQHVGLLVIDEIQNVVAHKQGRTLIAAVTQLINSSGTALCLVGTPECGDSFTQAFHLARRTVGLEYGPLEYHEFENLCESLFRYQYTGVWVEPTPAIIGKLFEFSNGIPAVAVSLLHDAQEICICGEKDCMDVVSISAAFENRHARLQPYIGQQVVKISQPNNTKRKKNNIDKNLPTEEENGNAVQTKPEMNPDILRDILSEKCPPEDCIAALISHGLPIVEV